MLRRNLLVSVNPTNELTIHPMSPFQVKAYTPDRHRVRANSFRLFLLLPTGPLQLQKSSSWPPLTVFVSVSYQRLLPVLVPRVCRVFCHWLICRECLPKL